MVANIFIKSTLLGGNYMSNSLFSSFQLKGLLLKNRIVMAPMCQYSVVAKDGIPNEWHYVHYVSRAIGGTGLIIMEMTDVDPDGRTTDQDLGLWNDEQIPAFTRIIEEVHANGAKIGIQIAHAGRKAEHVAVPVAPSAIAYPDSGFNMPRALTTEEVADVIQQFADSTRRAVQAGVDTIELHGAHGYLIHQFQSPLTNRRMDIYGDDFSRFGVDLIKAVKKEMPPNMPLIFRISAIEYADGGYGIDHAISLCKAYQAAGIDMFHVSTGGEGRPGKQKPGNYPGYQVPFARQIKNALDVPVIAVGMLEDPRLAQSVICNGDADLVAVARGMLRDPYWSTHAEEVLNNKPILVPMQYSSAY